MSHHINVALYIALDQSGFPVHSIYEDATTVARVQKLGRFSWSWQLWTVEPTLGRPALRRYIYQGTAFTKTQAIYRACIRTRAINERIRHDHR